MSRSDLQLLVPVVVGAALAVAGRAFFDRLARRRLTSWLERARREYDAAYDRSIEPQLVAHAERIVAVFGDAMLRYPEVDAAPTAATDSHAMLREIKTFAASRFAIEHVEIETAFARTLPAGLAAELQWDSSWEADVTGETIRMQRRETTNQRWRILVLDGSHGDPELLTVLVAREVAHVVLVTKHLEDRGVELDEALAEVAMVCAGFGSLLHRVAFREVRRSNGRVAWRRYAHLHRDAIDFLIGRREALTR